MWNIYLEFICRIFMWNIWPRQNSEEILKSGLHSTLAPNKYLLYLGTSTKNKQQENLYLK